MSALDVNWLRPVSPDGPMPLQILLDWFAHNGVVYHASSHQREVLRPLCRELNARGVPCEVDEILDFVIYLQEAVQEAATINRELPGPLKPYREHLQQFLFKDGHTGSSTTLESEQKARNRPVNRLSWLEPSSFSGPSGMEVLVEWLRCNYSAYAHASRKGEKGKMLEELVQQMKDAGIQECAVNTVRAKIDVLQREVRGEKGRSRAYEQFGAVLEEIFTMGDALEEDEDMGEAMEEEGAERDEVVEENHLIGIDDDRLPLSLSSSDGWTKGVGSFGDVKVSVTAKPVVKHTRNSPASRLAWMKPASPGAPTAMDLLVEWMVDHYAAYTQSTKKGDKGKMLNKLLRTMDEAGLKGCTIHAIRVKIDSLQRQATGKARPSSAFEQYGTSLRKVFAEKDSPEAFELQKHRLPIASQERPTEPRELATEPRELAPIPQEFDPNYAFGSPSEESSSGDDIGVSGDEAAEEVATEGSKSLGSEIIPNGKISAEPVLVQDIESQDVEDTTMDEVISSPKRAPTAFDSETEDDEDRLAKVKPIVPQARPQPQSPARAPSASEIVRIATLLRERHDLHQRGVPQEQIDKFLPLPHV